MDATGLFRFFLVLACWTGQRISTVRGFNRAVLLQTSEGIRSALNEQLCNYVAPYDRGRVSGLYAEIEALYIRYWMAKPG